MVAGIVMWVRQTAPRRLGIWNLCLCVAPLCVFALSVSDSGRYCILARHSWAPST